MSEDVGRFELSTTQQMGVEAAVSAIRQATVRAREAYRIHVGPLADEMAAEEQRLRKLVDACATEQGAEIPGDVRPTIEQNEETGALTGFVTWEIPKNVIKLPEAEDKAETEARKQG